jgi:uncharacterized protein YsxB (DUF464 family)
MIEFYVFRNKDGRICGFRVLNHGKRVVCAAVSALVLNTVNSVEAFTDEPMEGELPENGGGYLNFMLPDIRDGGYNEHADLLLSALMLGIHNISEQYPKQLSITESEV